MTRTVLRGPPERVIVACMDSLDWLVTLLGGVVLGLGLYGFLSASENKRP
jgi:hypothetical protein